MPEETPSENADMTDKVPDKANLGVAAVESTEAKPRPKRKRLVWHGLRLIWLSAILPVVFAGIAAAMLIDQDVAAPSWIKSRVAQSASDVLGGGKVTFGGIYVNVGRDLHPRVRLVDTVVKDANGATVARIAQISGLMSPRGLVFQQEVLMQDIALSGARIDLQRNQDGSVAVSFGETGGGETQQAGRLTGLLDLAGLALVQPGFAALETIRADNLIVNYTDVRAGRRWTVDGGTLSLDLRNNQTALRADMALLSGGAGVTTLALSYTSPRGSSEANLGLTITDAIAADIATQSAALSWLSDVTAPISATLRTTLDDRGNLGPLSATLALGKGVLQPNAATVPIAFDSAKMYLVLDPENKILRFDQIEVASNIGSFTASGQAFLGDNVDGLPQSMVGQFLFRDLDLHQSDKMAAPLGFNRAQIDLRLNLDPFSVEIGQAYLEGETLALHGRGDIAATDAGWRVALDVNTSAISQSAVMAIWPSDLQPWLRGWITDNLTLGEMSGMQVALRSVPDEAVNLFASFGFNDSVIRYLPDMPPIKAASGILSFDGTRMAVSLDDGHVIPPEGGEISVANSTMVIPDIALDRRPVQLDLRFDGAMAASMSLINQPPFHYADWLGIPVGFAQGRAQTRVLLAMPLSSKFTADEVIYDISADIRDFSTGFIVEGRQINASRLTMAMDNAGMTVTGTARLDGVPLTGTWDQRFATGASSTLRADMQLSQRFLDAFEIALPPGSVTGEGAARLDVTISPGGAANYTLTSDLQGIGVAIPPVGWSKSRNTAGNLRIVGTLGNRPTIDRLEISGGGLEAEGRIVLNRDGSLDRAVLSRLRVGNWLNAPITLRSRGANRPFAVSIQGGTLDLRRARFGAGGGDSGPLTIALDRLQVTEGVALTRFAGEFDGAGGFSGTFTAQVNGGPALQGTVAPRNGRSAVRLRSNDAGGVARAAGFLETGVGGTLDLTLLPAGGEGTFDGTLAIRQIRIRDAPAMAALLDAVSIVGALQQMDGQGLAFEEVDAQFRLTPQQVILTQSSAVGPGLGISLDGIYTLASGSMDFQGVISPFYLINSIGSILTREGEGLIGFNFNIYGSASAPQISVNPFSALTPGMFRDIFRRPPPVVTQ